MQAQTKEPLQDPPKAKSSSRQKLLFLKGMQSELTHQSHGLTSVGDGRVRRLCQQEKPPLSAKACVLTVQGFFEEVAWRCRGSASKKAMFLGTISHNSSVRVNGFSEEVAWKRRGSASKRRPLQGRYSRGRSMTGQDRLVALSEAEQASQQTGSQGGWGKLRKKLTTSKSILDPTRDRKVRTAIASSRFILMWMERCI